MSAVLDALKAQPDRPVVGDDPAEIARRFRRWRAQILITSIIGYALYYFVRKNISTPLKVMGEDLHINNASLGLIMTVGGVTYGVSKFFNGILGDRSNPRYFMAIGLVLSAGMNVCFGLSSALPMLIMFWMLNSWAQGMGFPPCARNMGYWFTPAERGTTFGLWHCSHMLGGATIAALTGYLTEAYGWRSSFFIPAGLAVLGAVIIVLFLRDTPGSLGLPPVEVHKGEETAQELAAETEAGQSYRQVLFDYVLKNPYMWLISFANLLVYVLRETQTNWGAKILQESKHMTLVKSGWLGAGSELAGMVSALVAGIIADRVFGGKAGRVCCFAMLLLAGVIYAFWKTPSSSPHLVTGLFVTMGFLLYVPQMLIAAMAMNLGTKRASAAAVGLTGIVGYLSTPISGVGMGMLRDHYGRWDEGMILLIACSVGTLVLMAFTWNVGAHPHAER